MDACTAANMNIEVKVRNGELAVIGANGVSGAMNPVQQIGAGHGCGLAVEANIDG